MLYTYINISLVFSLYICEVILLPFALTHCLINFCAFFPFRKKLGKYWSVFAILSGLLPDFDFVLGWILNWLGYTNSFFGHGGFFHSLGFVLVLLGISGIIYWKNKEFGKYGFILAIGTALHILTDYILGGGAYSLMLFFPFSTELFRLHLLESYKYIDIYGLLDAFLICIFLVIYFFKLKKEKKKK